MATRPLALRAYLRVIQKEQERYRGAHTSLAAFANVYQTPITHYPNTPDVSNSNVQTQAQVVSLLSVLQQQESHLLLLGDAGTGKTLALHLYLAEIAHQGWTRVRSRATIPVYIPLQDYSAFLLTAVKESAANAAQPGNPGNANNPDEVTERATLLDFLYETSLPGMHHLRPHLNSLLKQGRLELLCDGLEEVASAYRAQVSRQLANLMMITQDRFVIAARSADYTEARQLVDLVDGGFAARAIIFPLSSQAMRECIEQFIEAQNNGWHYTAGQLMQIITTTRLRYLCTNPLLLFTLLEMIEATNIDRAKVLDTRGSLLQAYVMQRITNEQETVATPVHCRCVIRHRPERRVPRATHALHSCCSGAQDLQGARRRDRSSGAFARASTRQSAGDRRRQTTYGALAAPAAQRGASTRRHARDPRGPPERTRDGRSVCEQRLLLVSHPSDRRQRSLLSRQIPGQMADREPGRSLRRRRRGRGTGQLAASWGRQRSGRCDGLGD